MNTAAMKLRPTIEVDRELQRFIDEEVLPLTGHNPKVFWAGVADIIDELSPVNRQLLARRDALQQQIDTWFQERPVAQRNNAAASEKFLREIGYLENSGPARPIVTEGVDDEIARLAGPQLVVPVSNARFALNAVNARWGSLYDALYGTDVISAEGDLAPGKGYNPKRGQAVIDFAKQFLDEHFPLAGASHREVKSYDTLGEVLHANLDDGRIALLQDPTQWVGYSRDEEDPERRALTLVLRKHGLHVMIHVDRDKPVGRQDPAGVADIEVEAALTVIMDCEDSVAAVDAADKVEVYRNWLGLIEGNLYSHFMKAGKDTVRTMHGDRLYHAPRGGDYALPGRALMLIRNVGLLMTSEMIRDADGEPVPEGILDGIFTSLIASLDLQPGRRLHNSRSGSIYIVKPKMHGPEEVRFTCTLFDRIEALLNLPANTLKLGIMDEERRTTVNLQACVDAARTRVVFINTGFLDRTGDEIHTAMQAGAFLPKGEIKNQAWIKAYEQNNVDVGLACGLVGRAQIGKGMWAMPDEMKKMLEEKIGHPKAGANTAWVPSPTAAVLHALHYHSVDVRDQQQKFRQRPAAALKDILTLALLPEDRTLSEEEIQRELENNVQGILGYVVRWVEMGVGCSKVPDIHNVGLMEDRATLRISSQHIANWLLHGICSEAAVRAAMQKMAAVVDQQNHGLEGYTPMTPDTSTSLAFQAAEQLVFAGRTQPNGYTEPLLHAFRQRAKTQQGN